MTFMIELRDDLSRVIEMPAPARSIVSLVPSITETLFALGAGECIVGVTDYCVHPAAEVGRIPKVGGTKNFFTEKVIAIQPDLVVANAEENRRHQVEKLEQAGLRVFVTLPKTVEGCIKMIEDMGTLTGTRPAAQAITKEIRDQREAAMRRAADPPVRVLCPIWKDPYMTINGDTYIDSVIQHCGGKNIFAHDPERYPQFTLEEAANRSPEVILLPTEPYHFSEADLDPFLAMGADVPAVRNRRIFIVEGELLSWYGPRLPQALRDISLLLAFPTSGR
jgi:ABC-type Fe3+-hydroxamate transport system substrate-binding protein